MQVLQLNHNGFSRQFAAAVLLLSATVSAQADDANEAKAVIDKILDNYATPVPEIRFDYNRDYTLAQDGDTYRADLPVFDLIIDQDRLSFGPLQIVVTPADKGLYTVSYRIGDTISAKEGEQTVATLKIGAQTGQGIWDTELQNFSSLQGRLAELDLDIADDPADATLGSIDYSYSLERDETDAWTYDQAFSLKNAKIIAEGITVTIAGLEGSGDMHGTDFSTLLAVSEKMNTLIRENSEQLAQDDPQAAKTVLDSVSKIFATLAGFESSLTLYKLSVEQGGQALGSVEQLSIDAGYGEGEDGLETSYAMALSGFQTAMAPLPPNLMPYEARIEIGLFNMPENLFQRFVEMGMASEKLSEAEQEAFWSQQLLELVMTTGMGLFVEDTYVGAEAARADLSLSAKAEPQSPLGGVGEFSLTIENMQNAIDTLGLANDEQVAPVLAMLTAFSNRTTEDGNTIDSFELQVTEEGKLMLNNKDVTAMFMPGAPIPEARPEGEETPTE